MCHGPLQLSRGCTACAGNRPKCSSFGFDELNFVQLALANFLWEISSVKSTDSTQFLTFKGASSHKINTFKHPYNQEHIHI